jgi:hypothetical protein
MKMKTITERAVPGLARGPGALRGPLAHAHTRGGGECESWASCPGRPAIPGPGAFVQVEAISTVGYRVQITCPQLAHDLPARPVLATARPGALCGPLRACPTGPYPVQARGRTRPGAARTTARAGRPARTRRVFDKSAGNASLYYRPESPREEQ